MVTHQLEFARSALIIVDMQNDFIHPDGGFAHLARENPEAAIDLPFLIGTIPQVKRLADAFRKAGRPVVYLAHVLKPDYGRTIPYWRLTRGNPSHNRTFITEGTWGAQIIDELKPLAKALFVPSLKRGIVLLLHAHDLRREGSHGNPHPTARIHIHTGRRCNRVPARGACAAASDARHRLPRNQIT